MAHPPFVQAFCDKTLKTIRAQVYIGIYRLISLPSWLSCSLHGLGALGLLSCSLGHHRAQKSISLWSELVVLANVCHSLLLNGIIGVAGSRACCLKNLLSIVHADQDVLRTTSCTPGCQDHLLVVF